MEETTDLSQVTDKLDHIMLYKYPINSIQTENVSGDRRMLVVIGEH